ESRYGVSLLERTPRGVWPTAQGTVLAEYADRILALLGDVKPAVDALESEPCGDVAIAASSTPGAYLLPGLIRRFRSEHPRVSCTLMTGDSAQVVGWLQEYRVPLGVIGETAGSPGIAKE